MRRPVQSAPRTPSADRATARQFAVPMPVAVSVVGTFLIVLIGALYYARSFVLPIVLALLLTLTFAPLVRALARRGIPAPATAILLVLSLGATVVIGTALLAGPFARLVEQAPEVVKEVRGQFAALGRPFALLNDATREMQALTNGTGATDEEEHVVIAQPGIIVWAAGTLAGVGTTIGAALLLAFFLLASGDELRHKLLGMSSRLTDKKRSLSVLRDIEKEVSRYLLTITSINVVFGACVGLIMYSLGMPNPALWAVAAGLLNFIPYLGGLVGTTLVVAAALVTYDSVPAMLAPPAAYVALQFIESSIVTPTILGRRLELHIVAILVFLAFTTWMWGVAGAILAVPLLVVVKVFSDQSPRLRPLSVLISARTNGAGDAEAVPEPREQEAPPRRLSGVFATEEQP